MGRSRGRGGRTGTKSSATPIDWTISHPHTETLTDSDTRVKVVLGSAHLDGHSDYGGAITQQPNLSATSCSRDHHRSSRLTSLQHLVTSLSDDVQADDLLVLALAYQLVRGRLLVLFLEHGKRHGFELSSRETDETIHHQLFLTPQKIRLGQRIEGELTLVL
jgi:hypothetical protein